MANVNCEACDARISEEAFRCPACGVEREVAGKVVAKKAPPPGWYPHKDRPGELRHWTGSEWADEWKVRGSSPGELIGWGVLLAVVAGGATGALVAIDAGPLAIVVGGILGLVATIVLTVGVVAKGVQVGVRAAKS